MEKDKRSTFDLASKLLSFRDPRSELRESSIFVSHSQETKADSKYMGSGHGSSEVDKSKVNTNAASRSPASKDGPVDYKTCTFTPMKVVGSGTFGVVYQASVLETQETVAIKKVLHDRRYKNRELAILKELAHPNVICIKHAFFTVSDENPDEKYYNIVMDFMPDTIFKVVRDYQKKKQIIPLLLVKLYAWQMIRGLFYINTLGICHRDIKPQNVLVDTTSNKLKICDFGSAKKLVPGEGNVAYICSRYYRAPELIFGATVYTHAIDTWSAGCVIAEMILGEPIFPGDSSTDQLVKIVKILGTPTAEMINAMNPSQKDLIKLPPIKPVPLSKVFVNKTDDFFFLDLLQHMLTYVPKARFTPQQCLAHPFFNDLRHQSFKCGGLKPQDLFKLTKEEIQAAGEYYNQIVPRWYQEQDEAPLLLSSTPEDAHK